MIPLCLIGGNCYSCGLSSLSSQQLLPVLSSESTFSVRNFWRYLLMLHNGFRFVDNKTLVRLLCVIIMGTGAVFFSGCQLWSLRTATIKPVSRQTKKIDDIATSSFLAFYSKDLEKDVWQQNRKWSPITARVFIPFDDERSATCQRRTHWVLYQQPVDDSSESKQTKTKTDKKKNDNHKEQTTEQQPPTTWKQRFRHLVNQEEKPVLGVPGLGDDYVNHLAYFSKQNNLRGWNATILLAQKRHDRMGEIHLRYAPVAETLERIVTQPLQYDVTTGDEVTKQSSEKETDKDESKEKPEPATISIAMRAAAAEAWCTYLAQLHDDPVDGLAPVGRLLEIAELPIEVHAELIRSVAKWVSPADIPRLGNAFQNVRDVTQSAPKQIRIAAIDACLVHANSLGKTTAWNDQLWSPEILNCQNDPESAVRKKFGQWLSVSQHPRAFAILKSQLYDQQTGVRNAALVSMGRLHTEEAKAELQQQMKRNNADKIRMTAIRGLSFWGEAEIAEYANDSSPHIRQAVAMSLSRHESVPSALILQKLILSSAPEVQKSAVAAVATWSDKVAIPLLITGFQDSSLVMTRERCLSQLRKRTLSQKPISANASQKERTTFVANLVDEFDLPSSYLGDIQKTAATALHHTNKVDIARQQELQQWVNDLLNNEPNSSLFIAAYQHLSQLEPADIPLVESHLLKKNEIKKAVFFHDLLPRQSEVFQTLQNFESRDVFKKRKAAQELSRLSEEVTLQPLVVKRLRLLLMNCQDRLVWRFVMQAVSQDATNDNAEIALLAIQNAWWDIRVLGCDYVSRHGRSQHALWLLPLFEDNNKNVRLAAVKAAGKCNHQVVLDGLRPQKKGDRDLPGLRSLLTDSDQEIHFQTVLSMSLLNDEQAMQELIRMSHHDNHKQKERTIVAMGQTGQSRFVQHLIQLGWIETRESTKRTILETLEVLVPKEKRPVQISHQSGYDKQIRQWVRWADQHKG